MFKHNSEELADTYHNLVPLFACMLVPLLLSAGSFWKRGTMCVIGDQLSGQSLELQLLWEKSCEHRGRQWRLTNKVLAQ